METIYITGHRNPDTDSIVSAMAYAALKNALGQRQYKAARLGQVSDETQIVLNRFGFEPEVTAKIAKKNIRILEVPISYYPRTNENDCVPLQCICGEIVLLHG